MSPSLRKRIVQAERRARAPRFNRHETATVATLFDAIARDLVELTEAQIYRLWPVLQDATRALRERLADLERAGKGDTFTAQKVRAALIQTKRAIDLARPRIATELGNAAQVMDRAAFEHMKATVAVMAKHGGADERGFGAPAVLDIDMASRLMEGRYARVPLYRASAERCAGEVWRGVQRSMAQSKLEGKGWREAAKSLEDVIGMPSADGLGATGLQYQAERLLRTESVAAYSGRVMDTARDEGYLLLWNAAMFRTCDLCRPLDGEKREPGQLFDGVTKPPRHPNCRCAVVLWSNEWGDI